MEIVNNPIAFLIFAVTVGWSLYLIFGKKKDISNLILNPYDFYHNKKYFQIITSGFIHIDLFHLLFNMITFYFFAFQLESMVGSINFLLIYFSSMILADIPSIIKYKNEPNYNTLGASGAISGVLFSFILFEPYSGIMIFPIPIPIPAVIFGVIYLIYCQVALKKFSDGINHDAHFWGAIAGVISTIILIPNILKHFINKLF